jgi:hypothetical protein
MGFPPEIQAVLKQHPALAAAIPLLIFPEWKVTLAGGSTSSQNDAWVLAKNQSDLISITVEGKVEERFDRTLAEWKADASPGKEKRFMYAFVFLKWGAATVLGLFTLGFVVGGERMANVLAVIWGTRPLWSELEGWLYEHETVAAVLGFALVALVVGVS